MSNWELAFWAYLALAFLGLAAPLIWNEFKPRGAFFDRDAANEFEWLSQEERNRLNFHLNREKSLLDYWRKVIDRYYIVLYYCTIYSVIAPIFMAALAPLTTDMASGRHISSFLSLISIHLAITLGLFKSLKIEKTLHDGLRFESDFYALFYRFQDARADPGKTNGDRIDAYLKKYEEIRRRMYEGEISALPEARDEGAKKRYEKGA
jgi:hypothetical protein